MAGKAGSETARVEEWQGMFWLLQLTDSAAGHHLLENRLAWMIKPACEASSHQEGMKLEYCSTLTIPTSGTQSGGVTIFGVGRIHLEFCRNCRPRMTVSLMTRRQQLMMARQQNQTANKARSKTGSQLTVQLIVACSLGHMSLV